MTDFDADAPALAGAGLYGLPHGADEAGVVLVAVPFDATTSYRRGAADGPEAIKRASHQVDLFDVELGPIHRAGIALVSDSEDLLLRNERARALADPIIAAGGAGDDPELTTRLAQVNAESAAVNAWVEAEVGRWLDRGRVVGLVGGDHSTPFGAIAAHAARHPGFGILHLDAHADLRVAYEGFTDSHASIMYNVCERLPGVARLVQVGVRDLGSAEHAYIAASGGRIVTHFDADLARRRLDGVPWSVQVARIVAGLPDRVYLSWDIDGLDPQLCPHTGTPVPGGLSFHEACGLLRAVVESGRVVIGFDLNEVAPGPDPEDEWDGNVAARLLYKMIGWTLRSRGLLPPSA